MTEQQEDKKSVTLQFGYIVGVDSDGKFVFEMHGKERGIAQLLGIHAYAGSQLNVLRDAALGQGFPALAGKLQDLEEKLTKLTDALVKGTDKVDSVLDNVSEAVNDKLEDVADTVKQVKKKISRKK